MARLGTGVAPAEMARTFNCGIGMVVVVSASAASAVEALIQAQGEAVYRIGVLESASSATAEPAVIIDHLDVAF